jgi:hypothetical protein
MSRAASRSYLPEKECVVRFLEGRGKHGRTMFRTLEIFRGAREVPRAIRFNFRESTERARERVRPHPPANPEH